MAATSKRDRPTLLGPRATGLKSLARTTTRTPSPKLESRWIRRPRRPPVARPLCPLAPPVVSTTPSHPGASPDRPGAVTVSRIVARNSHHPEPYTGTRTVLVCSSRPRGSAAAAGGRTPPRTPPCAGGDPKGPETTPIILGRQLGALLRRLGGGQAPN